MFKAALVTLVLVPQLALGATPRVFGWEDAEVHGKQVRCFDFEGFKRLRLLEHDFDAQGESLQALQEQVELLTESNKRLVDATGLLNTALDDQKTLTGDIQNQRDAALKKSARYQSRDVWGGGFPWLIAAFAFGVGTGLYLHQRHDR